MRPFGLDLSELTAPFRRRPTAEPEVAPDPNEPAPRSYVRVTGSVSRRMLVVASAWIMLLLLGGGYTLDRVITAALTKNFDDQLEYLMKKMLLYAEIGPQGEVLLENAFADQRFIEPYSGAYWQVSGKGFEPFKSNSLWTDLTLRADNRHTDKKSHFYDSDEFRGQHFDYLIDLCDKTTDEGDELPSSREVLVWNFADPATSDQHDPFRHTLQEISERLKLFEMVKNRD